MRERSICAKIIRTQGAGGTSSKCRTAQGSGLGRVPEDRNIIPRQRIIQLT